MPLCDVSRYLKSSAFSTIILFILCVEFLNNSAVICFYGHTLEEKQEKTMQCPLQFINVSRILDENAAGRQIFQEFASQCEQNSGWNSDHIVSLVLEADDFSY